MRILFTLLFFSTFTLFAGAQPWMRYYQPGKGTASLDRFRNLNTAFETYMKDRDLPSAGEGEEDESAELFERWRWLAETRFTPEGTTGSQILWEEILKKEAAALQGNQMGAWQSLGPEDPPTMLLSGQVIGTGRIDCIAFHPTDTNTFYIGAPTGGIWKTTDGGHTWAPLGDMLASIGISDIALYPGHPDTIFIATGDRDAGDIYSVGVLRSNDGGATWQETGLSFNLSEGYRVNRLVIRPDQPDTLLAATSNGLYLISQDGTKAVRVKSGNFKDLELMPGNSRVIYAATYGYGSAGVYRSTNGGNSFNDITGDIARDKIIRIDLAVTPDKPDMVYAVTVDKQTSGLYALYRSFNRGDGWTKMISGATKNILGNAVDGNSNEGQGWYDLSMAVDPHDRNHLYVGGINVWESKNGGGTWNIKTYGYPEYLDTAAYIHVDQHILKFQPGTDALFAGNDGGLYKSNDGGNSFQNLSYGLQILQIYRIAITNQKRKMALMGSQDNSSILWRDTSWHVLIGGDGMECIIDPTDTSTLYASSQYGKIKKSIDDGEHFINIKPGDASKGAWVTPYTLSPDDPLVIYAGYTELYKSMSQGTSWEKITDNLSQGRKFLLIKVSSRDPDFIYAGTSDNLWRSEDGGQSWTSIRTGLPDEVRVSDLAISQYDPRRIWVTLSGYAPNQKVYYSKNGGTSWTNYSAGLPNIPVNCIVYQDHSQSQLYIGTDLGVYIRNGSMETWQDYSKELPNVIVNEMQIYYPDSLLRAGTYGRGLWESPLYFPDTVPLYAEFSSNKLHSCLNSDFTFYNEYPGEKDSVVWYFYPDAEPERVRNDTATVRFSTPGGKNVAMVIYHNGESDSIFRKGYITVDTTINVSIEKNYQEYYWHGNDLILTGKGADEYMWVVRPAQDTLYGERILTRPDTAVTYEMFGVQGSCLSAETLSVKIWPNDNIRYALELSYGKNGPYINNEATVERGEPYPPAGDCNTDSTWCDEFDTGEGYLAHSVWFRLEAPASGVVSIDTKGFDTQIALYDADSPDDLLQGRYTLLAANDDYHDNNENYSAALQEVSGLTPGRTYWLQLDGSGGNMEGTFYVFLYDSPLAVPAVPAGNRQTTGSFTVYPNPNEGSFLLRCTTPLAPGSLLKIYGFDGKLIHQQILPAAVAGQEIRPAVKLRKSGLYILMITSGRKVYTARMVVR